MRLRCDAFAKVNRSLLVLGKRPDGYHELDTVFQSIDFADELLFEPALSFELRCGDSSVPAGDENLVSRAARALERESGRTAAVRVTLTKRIPAGGGLGGGSSDAAAALRGISALLSLGLSETRLETIAASLGSDVPFFLVGGRARGTGRGERITPLPDLEEEALLLLLPPFPLATPVVFGALSASALTDVPAASNMPPSEPGLVPDRNDLEPVAESFRVELRDLRRSLVAAGARSARLSGSGSTVFGVFGNVKEAEAAARRLGPFEDGTRAVAACTLSRAEYARRSSPQVV
jgi:4-diphosphocytidyl-2-C-methyl-D-erythritol kinase